MTGTVELASLEECLTIPMYIICDFSTHERVHIYICVYIDIWVSKCIYACGLDALIWPSLRELPAWLEASNVPSHGATRVPAWTGAGARTGSG